MRLLLAVILVTVLLGCESEDPAMQIPTIRSTLQTQAAEIPGPALKKEPAPNPDRVLEKTFDDIKFEMSVGEPFQRAMLGDQIEELAGKRIRIRGFILPTPQKRGIKQFVLVRDNQECCFGPGAALYDCILVQMETGKTAEFSIRPVTTVGQFSIDELIGPDGNHLAIYRLEAESVE